jgi:hypothetical protein
MNEVCPLGGFTWSANIPTTCRETCESLWDTAIQTQNPELDTFTLDCEVDTECVHDIEPSDTSLQRGEGSKRFVGLLNVCSWNQTELFSESFSFNCPNN